VLAREGKSIKVSEEREKRERKRLTVCPLKSPAVLSSREGKPATRTVVGQSTIRDLERIPQRDLTVGGINARGVDHIGERHQFRRANETESLVDNANWVRVELI
jgi:hypothetical protein